MRNFHLESIVEYKNVTDDIICNKCGNSCKDSCDMNYEGLIEASVFGGYASKLGDQVNYEFSLCEDCLIELFKTFKHNPRINNEEENI